MATKASPNAFKFKSSPYQALGSFHSRDAQVIDVDGEPMIKIYPKDQVPELFSYEELLVLKSSILSDPWCYTVGMSVAEELWMERVRHGQKVILDTWSALGYTASEFAKEPKANKNLVLGTLVPTLKSKTDTRAPAAKFILKFVIPDGRTLIQMGKAAPCPGIASEIAPAYWALVNKESKAEILTVPWNDYEGLKELASACLDHEYTGVLFALTNPNAAEKLIAKQKSQVVANVNEKQTHNYFVDAVFGSAQQKEVLALVEKYNLGLDKAVAQAKKEGRLRFSWPISEITHFKARQDVIGLYRNRKKDPIEMLFAVGVKDEVSRYSHQPTTFKASVRKQEAVLWASLKSEARKLGYSISNLKPPLRQTDYRRREIVFRSFKVIRKPDQYKVITENNKTEKQLHLYVEKQLAKKSKK